ncbi:ferrous iron transport protein A [Blastopirellula marina]|uniref:Ferrous iron transport protein A n=1 Tax=Blastopirellula marina TaxID=124 RepID=A0A2S8G6W6_9BACT|nr:FeoA family protein [Blastopirellula marina]PQO40167.1 ferrous iron transport protein A [Blastopirellula marina]PQO43561.1 ferrous iron transport protein A [Blastopirellula marina]PTL45534.1 ferrous iron transport protein A [Blastopirellula marina]
MMPLDMLPIGQTAEISDVLGDQNDVKRLAEMGLRCGVVVQVVQQGSPCIIRVDGSTLCFRECQHLQVFVEPVSAAV